MIKLEQYRDTWLSEKMDEVIGFYPREFYPLDNFSSFKVEWNGYLYASLEEAYQAASFMGSDEELVEKVKHSHSADEAQRIAYANRDKQRPDWDEIKLGVMEELLRLKLAQNPYVEKKLLQTEDYLIVEDSPKDSFWGWGPNRDGENHLGKLWMKLRDELREYNNIDYKKIRREEFERTLKKDGLYNKDSFMVGYYDGRAVPIDHPDSNKYRNSIYIVKNNGEISGKVGFDGIEYNLTEEVVNKVYDYIEMNIDKLRELDNNQGPIPDSCAPLMVKYKLDMICLYSAAASEADKIIMNQIVEDIRRIILENSTIKGE